MAFSKDELKLITSTLNNKIEDINTKIHHLSLEQEKLERALELLDDNEDLDEYETEYITNLCN